MLADRFGLALSTSSASARDAYVDASERALTFYPGGLVAYDDARAADANFALAHAGKALQQQSTVADLSQRYEVHPNQIYAWKKQLQEQATRAFDPGVGRDAEAEREREIEKLHAKIGQLTVERDFLAKRSGR